MDINHALDLLGAAEANLEKLDRLWERIAGLLPLSANSWPCGVDKPEEYEQLVRDFAHVAGAMPPIHGHALDVTLCDGDEVLQFTFDACELDTPDAILTTVKHLSSQGAALRDFKHRLAALRRALIKEPMQAVIDRASQAARDMRTALDAKLYESDSVDRLDACVQEIGALLGSRVKSVPRWGDLVRHLHFRDSDDQADIVRNDWPRVRDSIVALLFGDDSPVPVPVADLGAIAAGKPKGRPSIALDWSVLSPGEFERLVFDLLSTTDGFEEVQWATHPNAPDRGRDISAYRRLPHALGVSQRQRVIVQCRHKPAGSGGIRDTDLGALTSQMKHWVAPPVDVLMVFTSGTFTDTAVSFAEIQNASDTRLRIELHSSGHLERELAQRPELVAAAGLRRVAAPLRHDDAAASAEPREGT